MQNEQTPTAQPDNTAAHSASSHPSTNPLIQQSNTPPPSAHPTNPTIHQSTNPPACAVSDTPVARADLEHLLNGQPTLSLERVAPAPPATVIDATVPATLPQSNARRRGRIARLPKIHRDMVNRMLSNGVPYKNIVAALHEVGFHVIERNISNWARGGYLEWRLAQDLVIENRLAQDQLVDHLRREDASEISEVGLQAAATRVSQMLLQKAARADNVEENLGSFSQLVDLLSRLNREITICQKQRDDSRRTLGPHHDAARIKNEDEKSTWELERDYSDPEVTDDGLEKPAVRPLLAAYPTSSRLETEDFTKKIRDQRAHRQMVQMLLSGSRASNTSSTTASLPAPESSSNNSAQ